MAAIAPIWHGDPNYYQTYGSTRLTITPTRRVIVYQTKTVPDPEIEEENEKLKSEVKLLRKMLLDKAI